jgi:hypothetical protein
MKSSILACLLAFAATTAALATPVATVRGTITDPAHNQAVAGAEISLHTAAGILRTHTNSHGAFWFVGVPAGRVELAINAERYEPVTVATCAVPDETRILPLFLVQMPLVITNTAALARYENGVYLHDNAVASAPHFALMTNQYVLGFCPG